MRLVIFQERVDILKRLKDGNSKGLIFCKELQNEGFRGSLKGIGFL